MKKDQKSKVYGLSLPEDETFAIVSPKVVYDTTLSSEARMIYVVLCCHASAIGFCYPSVETICEKLGYSKNRYYAHSKELIDHGYVKIKKVKNQTTGSVYNLYRILDPIYMHNYKLDQKNVMQADPTFKYDPAPDPELEELFPTKN